MNSIDFKIIINRAGGKRVFELWCGKSGDVIFYDFLDVEPQFEDQLIHLIWQKTLSKKKL
jgi:hypothetical protein